MTDTSPAKAWGVVAAATAVNLCLGILYAWGVWKSTLLADVNHPPGSAMTGPNAGWVYLTDTQATAAYALCGLTFALCMIPGGRLQDRFGPRVGVTVGGLALAIGCILAGWFQSFVGLLVGFGLFGGLGMGFGYAAATPAAVRWFGPHRRGLIVGIVVGGYGAAAIYIAPLAKTLIDGFGLSGSFFALGGLFALVVLVAGRLLVPPPPGFVVPTGPKTDPNIVNRTPGEVLGSWRYYALVLLMLGSAQSGLLVIANAVGLLKGAAKTVPVLAENAWLLAAFGGLMNALGRVGTGYLSDHVGRRNAYTLNGLAAVVGLIALPWVVDIGHVGGLFVVVGIAFWQYGGGLSVLPAFTSDLFGPKHFGVNYGLVFLGWGLAFLVPLAAGFINDLTGRTSDPYYLSAALLFCCVVLCRIVRK